jgi:methionyl-tRNA formyltransferase
MSVRIIRVVFMGTSRFAVSALEALAKRSDVEIVEVYTSPDSVSRRGNKRFPSPVKAAAEELGLSVRTPSTLRDEREIAVLSALEPDLIVVVSYGFILPRAALDIPHYGCINIHASLLPRWRGAAPIQRAILAGDSSTGVSLMRMEEGLDTGDYCAQKTIPLSDADCHAGMSERLARLGADILEDNIEDIITGKVKWVVQDETEATYADKIEKAEMLLSPRMTARELLSRIHASSDHAPARINVGGKDIRICSAEKISYMAPDAPGGTKKLKSGMLVIEKDDVFMSGSDPDSEVLVIKQVKPAGSREMPANQWARGMRIQGEVTWG